MSTLWIDLRNNNLYKFAEIILKKVLSFYQYIWSLLLESLLLLEHQINASVYSYVRKCEAHLIRNYFMKQTERKLRFSTCDVNVGFSVHLFGPYWMDFHNILYRHP